MRQPWQKYSAVQILMGIIVVVFVGEMLATSAGIIGSKVFGHVRYEFDVVTLYGSIIPQAIKAGQVWRLLSYAFLHSTNSLFHILFNLLGLWMFGRILEYRWGFKKFLTFYLLAAISAGLFTTLVYLGMDKPLLSVGASGAIMALFVMFGMYYPYERIYIFGILPIEARFAVPLFAFISFYFGFTGGGGNIDHFTHLGGIIAGLTYYQFERPIDTFFKHIYSGFQKPFLPKPDNVYKFSDAQHTKVSSEDELDRILKKVSAKGINSLTVEEQIILQKHSDKLKG